MPFDYQSVSATETPTVEIVDDLPTTNAELMNSLAGYSDEEILFELAKRKKDPIPSGSIHVRSFLWGAGTTAVAMFLSRILRKGR